MWDLDCFGLDIESLAPLARAMKKVELRAGREDTAALDNDLAISGLHLNNVYYKTASIV